MINLLRSEKKLTKSVDAVHDGEVSEAMDQIKQKSLMEQLANAYTELEKLRKQFQPCAGTVEFAELLTSRYSGTTKYWLNSNTQDFTNSVTELEPKLTNRLNEHDIIPQLKQRVEEQEQNLHVKEKEIQAERKLVKELNERVRELEQTVDQTKRKIFSANGEEDAVSTLQSRIAELEAELRQSIPFEQFNKMQLNIDVQLKNLTQERNELALKLCQALVDLESFQSSAEIIIEEETLEHLLDPVTMLGKCICYFCICSIIKY